MKKRNIKILTLDLAGTSGYAMLFKSGRIKTGVKELAYGKLTSKRNPLPMQRLYNWLNDLCNKYLIESVVFEETFARGSAKYRLDSLQHATILWAMQNKIKWSRVSPTTWKKAVLGHGFVNKVEYTKATQLFFPEINLATHDHCAAMCLLQYSLGNKIPCTIPNLKPKRRKKK